MKLIKMLLPHLAVACSLAVLGVAIFNGFNPRMGFLQGTEALVLIVTTVVLNVATAVIAMTSQDH